MEKICSLSFGEAISAISDTTNVMYRHGVWNSYSLEDTEFAINAIKRSGYGADVFKKNDMYYVSIPCDSDMW